MKSFNLIEKAFLLKKTSLFGALDLDLLLSISDKMEYVTFKPEEKIFYFDHDAHRMYLLVEGHVVIKNRHGQILAHLKSGEFFGDEALFSKKPRAYMALCHTASTLLALSRSHLMSIVEECPSVAIALLEAHTEWVDFRRRGHEC